MNREEVLAKLREQRAEFDARFHAIPSEAMDMPIHGAAHSPKQILAHVSAYERLIVERLRAARLGETTEFDRDRIGWEAFNDRVWEEALEVPADVVLSRSAADFLALLEEVAGLSDGELVDRRGITAAADPSWLQGRPLWEAIGVDGFDHYPMHFAQLEAAKAK